MIKAILLAAGQSKRLGAENKLLKLYKKKPLINFSLNSLNKSKVNKIIIVLGYQNKEVKKVIRKKKKFIFFEQSIELCKRWVKSPVTFLDVNFSRRDFD